MNSSQLKTKIFFLTIIAVVLASVSYYFWEDYLFSHFLGGYDQYGLPKQVSHQGFYFFISAWPVWLYPIFLLCLLAGILYLIGFDEKIKAARQNYLQTQKIRKEKQALKQELQNVHGQLDATRAQLRKKVDQLKSKNLQVEEEYSDLMAEYQKSLSIIEKLLVEQQKKMDP